MTERYPGRDVHEAIDVTLRFIEESEPRCLNLLAEMAALERARRDFRKQFDCVAERVLRDVEYQIELAQMTLPQRITRFWRTGPTRGNVRAKLDDSARGWLRFLASAANTGGRERFWKLHVLGVVPAKELSVVEEKMGSARQHFNDRYAEEISRCRDHLKHLADSLEVELGGADRRPPKLKAQIAKLREMTAAIEAAVSSIVADPSVGADDGEVGAGDFGIAEEDAVMATDFIALDTEYKAIREMARQSTLTWYNDRSEWEGTYWDRFDRVAKLVNAPDSERKLAFLFTPAAEDVLGPLPPTPPLKSDGTVDPRHLGLTTARVRFAPTIPDPNNAYVAWIERVSAVLELRDKLIVAGFLEPTEMGHPFGPRPDPEDAGFNPEWARLRDSLVKNVKDRTLNYGFGDSYGVSVSSQPERVFISHGSSW